MEKDEKMSIFGTEISRIVNSLSLDNRTNTPDFVLAVFLEKVFCAYEEAISERAKYTIPMVEGIKILEYKESKKITKTYEYDEDGRVIKEIITEE